MKIADMHCDTISSLWQRQKGEEKESWSLRENGGHVDLIKLKNSGYLLQNFALFVDKKSCNDPWEEVQQLYALYQEETEKNKDILAEVRCFEDIEKNRKEGKISAFLTVEEGGVCKGEIDKLCKLYEQGVRMMTLTWNYPNEMGFPNLDGSKRKTPYSAEPEKTKGLTGKGREFVCKMEELGMIVDVSHLSDAGFYDVLDSTEKPFVASHSNARAVCPCVRNLTDDMIRKLAQRGGVMGLNFCADFLEWLPAGTPNPGTIRAIVEHARHIVKVGGIEVLGLGSDFDGIATHGELPHAGRMSLLYDALGDGGFSERERDKIFSENVLRVYREVLS